MAKNTNRYHVAKNPWETDTYEDSTEAMEALKEMTNEDEHIWVTSNRTLRKANSINRSRGFNTGFATAGLVSAGAGLLYMLLDRIQEKKDYKKWNND